MKRKTIKGSSAYNSLYNKSFNNSSRGFWGLTGYHQADFGIRVII